MQGGNIKKEYFRDYSLEIQKINYEEIKNTKKFSPIPFIPAINQKAISSTNLAKNYVSGMYELNSKTKIYVNTGIGTTHVSGRLGVVPEISIFHIYL